jgi:hypothetical protein
VCAKSKQEHRRKTQPFTCEKRLNRRKASSRFAVVENHTTHTPSRKQSNTAHHYCSMGVSRRMFQCQCRHGYDTLCIAVPWTILVFAVTTAVLVSAQEAANGGTVLNGGIVTRYDVSEWADLSWDLRDMRTLSDKQRLKNLFDQGLNAKKSDGSFISLSSLSSIFHSSKPDEDVVAPHILYHIYGLTSDLPLATTTWQARLDAVSSYPSDFMHRLISSSSPALAADAAIALVLWPYAAHLLYTGVWVCRERTEADERGIFRDVTHFDQFIALWIGRDQTAGSAVDGHGLYAWTQSVNAFFDFSNTSPEATINTRIKLLYQEAASALSLPNACTKDNPETFHTLWSVATQIRKEMIKPLFQWFIYHFVFESPAESELYAKALMPQLSRCRPSRFNRLIEATRAGISFNDKDTILRDLVDTYASCWGNSCNDLSSADFAAKYPPLQCVDTVNDESPPSLAGYRATTAVAPVSVIVARGSSSYGRNIRIPRHDSPALTFCLVGLSSLAYRCRASTWTFEKFVFSPA